MEIPILLGALLVLIAISLRRGRSDSGDRSKDLPYDMRHKNYGDPFH